VVLPPAEWVSATAGVSNLGFPPTPPQNRVSVCKNFAIISERDLNLKSSIKKTSGAER